MIQNTNWNKTRQSLKVNDVFFVLLIFFISIIHVSCSEIKQNTSSEKQLNDEYYLVLEDSDTLKASMSYGIDRKNGSNRYYVLRYKDKVKDNEKPKNNANFHLLLETDSSGKVVSYKITHNSEMFRFEYHDSIPFYEYSFPYNE